MRPLTSNLTEPYWQLDEIRSHEMNEFAWGIVLDRGEPKPRVCAVGCFTDQRPARQGEVREMTEGKQK